MSGLTTANVKARALALLEDDPSLAVKELQRRKDVKIAKAKGTPAPAVVEWSFKALRKEDLAPYALKALGDDA